MYEIIVLGATFAAAGIAHKYKEKCLVIERRAQAGYEFFGALHLDTEETAIYPHFKSGHTLFCTELVSVEKTDKGFACVTHGVNGYCTYYARKVVDTRCNDEMSLSKTYNLLVHSQGMPVLTKGHCKKAKGENRYVVCCPVPVTWGYVEAREAAANMMEAFSEEQRGILFANEFDYCVKEGYPKIQDGILYLPSKAYQTPEHAFAAGVRVEEEAN